MRRHRFVSFCPLFVAPSSALEGPLLCHAIKKEQRVVSTGASCTNVLVPSPGGLSSVFEDNPKKSADNEIFLGSQSGGQMTMAMNEDLCPMALCHPPPQRGCVARAESKEHFKDSSVSVPCCGLKLTCSCGVRGTSFCPSSLSQAIDPHLPPCFSSLEPASTPHHLGSVIQLSSLLPKNPTPLPHFHLKFWKVY